MLRFESNEVSRPSLNPGLFLTMTLTRCGNACPCRKLSRPPFAVQDFDNSDAVATEFVLNGPKLFVLVADLARNLSLYTYQPDHPQSWAGRRMLPV